MKFGETLYQRSIPQWAPYNVDYNSLKRLIKQRTTERASGPVSIPDQGPLHAVWQPLDDELFPVLRHEHDRAALFILSKLGEISRRLASIERQVQLAEQKVSPATSRPIQHTRKYHRLAKEADSIGNDLEALSRFASAQRLAFRKILKKYHKWTGSPSLHIRMDNEVLGHVGRDVDEVLGKSSNALNPNMSQYLIRLNVATIKLQSHMDKQTLAQSSRSSSKQPPTPEATPSLSQFEFERALITTSDSRTKRTYWIHHDNLDEVKVLLMRRLKPCAFTTVGKSTTPKSNTSSVVLLDDDSGLRNSRNIAVAKIVARWSDDDVAYIRERREYKQLLEEVRRKDLLKRLEEKATTGLKQVALIKSSRECFCEDDSSSQLAALETNIQIGHFNHTSLEDAITGGLYPIHSKTLPHSILTVAYTDANITPKIITILDHSHLVQPVPDFSLESQAMYTQVGHFEEPPWKLTLESDIRKVPAATPKKPQGRGRRPSATASSGPSSIEAQDSIYSQPGHYSSQTSLGAGTDPTISPLATNAGRKDPMSTAGAAAGKKPRRKRKSSGVVQAEAPQRYWNEFDDDPEFNTEEAYAIYVTPDEPFTFPGADTISKAFGKMYKSLGKSKKHVLSWLPLAKDQVGTPNERTRLFNHIESPTETEREADVESSSDDNVVIPKKAKRIASRSSRHGASRSRYGDYSALGYPRRTSRDQLLSHTSIGLHILSLVFLVMATILKGTGRKKAAIEVDAGVISAIVISVACAMFAIGCALARREPVRMSEWTVISLLVLCEIIWGICLGVWLAQSAVAAR
jgi:SPX domain protein involved in polyphosphate accumulation